MADSESTPTVYWKPDLGDEVWMNHPDGRKLGIVVGFVDDDAQPRAGQPIIDDAGEPGRRFIIHPMFLLPFEIGGPEWCRARDEGRVR